MSNKPKSDITKEGIEIDLQKLTSMLHDFPIEVFPKSLQHIVQEYSRVTGAPACFLGGAMLAVAGVALGNSAHLTYGNYSANGVLFLCVIGRRGTGKTHPIDFILRPLKEIDRVMWKTYKEERAIWLEQIKLKPKSKEPEPAQPPLSTTTDTTPEGLISLHENNPKSLLIHRDELSGLVESFDQYSKGGEAQKYLQIWNGSPVSVTRKSSGTTRIDKPHVSIIGGIQPELLPKLAEKSRISDGFLDRFLFCYPSQCIAQPDSMEVVDSIAWKNCIIAMHTIEPCKNTETGEQSPIILRLSEKARDVLAANSESLRGMINSSIDDFENPSGGIAAKLRIYQYRFALILHGIRYGCGMICRFSEVDEESARGAVLLSEYFLNTALKVHSNLSDKVKRSYIVRRVHKLIESRMPVRAIAELLEISVGTVSKYSKEIP